MSGDLDGEENCAGVSEQLRRSEEDVLVLGFDSRRRTATLDPPMIPLLCRCGRTDSI